MEIYNRNVIEAGMTNLRFLLLFFTKRKGKKLQNEKAKTRIEKAK